MSSEQNNNAQRGGQNHGNEKELEKYGVWVKSGPKDIITEKKPPADDTLDMQDLPDFSFITDDKAADSLFDDTHESEITDNSEETDFDALPDFEDDLNINAVQSDSFVLQDMDEADFPPSLPDDSEFPPDGEFSEEIILDDSAVHTEEDDPFAALSIENSGLDDNSFSEEITEENFDIPDFGETLSEPFAVETDENAETIAPPSFETNDPLDVTILTENSDETLFMDAADEISTGEHIPEEEPFDDHNMTEPIQQILGSTTDSAPTFDDINEISDFQDTTTAPSAASDSAEEKRILLEIARELSGLRLEFAQLKQEIETLKFSGSSTAQAPGSSAEADAETESDDISLPQADEKAASGFFSDEDEDETISLSGDELINILATADFTEENTAEPEGVQDSESVQDSEGVQDSENFPGSEEADAFEPAEISDGSDTEIIPEINEFETVSGDLTEQQEIIPEEIQDFMPETEVAETDFIEPVIAEETADDGVNADTLIDNLDSSVFSSDSIIQKIEFDNENLEEPLLEELVLPEVEETVETEEIIIQRPEDILVDSSEAFFSDDEAGEEPFTEETLEAEELVNIADNPEPLAELTGENEEAVTVIDNVAGFEEISVENVLAETEPDSQELEDPFKDVLTDTISDESLSPEGFDEISPEAFSAGEEIPQDPFSDVPITDDEAETLQDPVETLFEQVETAENGSPETDFNENVFSDSFDILDGEPAGNSVQPETEKPGEIVFGESAESVDSPEAADSAESDKFLMEEETSGEETATEFAFSEEPDFTETVAEEPLKEIELATDDNIFAEAADSDDVQSDEPTETVFESDQWNEPSLQLDENIEKVPPVEEPAETPEAHEAVIPVDLKQEIRSVLSYMDQLLESLPEEKIAEFAQSEHFEVYRKLFKEMGLSE